MEPAALPALVDKNIRMLHDGQQALVVDPGDAGPVIETCASRGLKLTAILVTRHHADHNRGPGGLRARPGAPARHVATPGTRKNNFK